MPHQISNQAAVISNRFRSLPVRDPSGLNDRCIVAHVVDQRHESVRENGMTNSNLPIGFGYSRALHRGRTISHEAGTELRKIKAAKEVVKQRGKT
jgi:hypothetical protein